jgi:hypothetical protein
MKNGLIGNQVPPGSLVTQSLGSQLLHPSKPIRTFIFTKQPNNINPTKRNTKNKFPLTLMGVQAP